MKLFKQIITIIIFFSLNPDLNAQSPNNDCINAQCISPADGIINSTTIGATSECGGGAECDCSAIGTWGNIPPAGTICYSVNRSVWFYFTTGSNSIPIGSLSVNISATYGCLNVETQIQGVILASANPCNCASWSVASTCEDREANGFTLTNNVILTPTTTYWINIDADALNGGGNIPAECNFDISISAPLTINDCDPCSNPPIATISAFTDATCGNSNGSATVTASNGTPPYAYSWNTIPSQNTQTATGLSAGTYTVIVSDINNCSDTTQITINNIGGPTANISGITITNASCGICDGSITGIIVSGGTSPYTYSWNTSPVQTTINATGLCGGSYTLTVTDADGCTATAGPFTINDIGGPIINTSTMTISDANCSGICDGSITGINVSGGTSPYSYSWNTSPVQTTIDATGLCGGSYSLTVTDINGCSASNNVTIGQTSGPSAGFSANPKQTNININITFLANSGGNIVSWQWDFGDGSTATGQNCTHQYGAIGTYTVTLIVTDADGCIDSVSDIIEIRDIFTLYIPNTFTPDGDGFNDFFFPQGVNVDPNNFDMYIFNRWGNLMFHTTTWVSTYGEPWNGTKNNSGTINNVVMDVYVYRILAKEIQGPKHEYIGSVTLMP